MKQLSNSAYRPASEPRSDARITPELRMCKTKFLATPLWSPPHTVGRDFFSCTLSHTHTHQTRLTRKWGKKKKTHIAPIAACLRFRRWAQTKWWAKMPIRVRRDQMAGERKTWWKYIFLFGLFILCRLVLFLPAGIELECKFSLKIHWRRLEMRRVPKVDGNEKSMHCLVFPSKLGIEERIERNHEIGRWSRCRRIGFFPFGSERT